MRYTIINIISAIYFVAKVSSMAPLSTSSTSSMDLYETENYRKNGWMRHKSTFAGFDETFKLSDFVEFNEQDHYATRTFDAFFHRSLSDHYYSEFDDEYYSISDAEVIIHPEGSREHTGQIGRIFTDADTVSVSFISVLLSVGGLHGRICSDIRTIADEIADDTMFSADYIYRILTRDGTHGWNPVLSCRAVIDAIGSSDLETMSSFRVMTIPVCLVPYYKSGSESIGVDPPTIELIYDRAWTDMTIETGPVTGLTVDDENSIERDEDDIKYMMQMIMRRYN